MPAEFIGKAECPAMRKILFLLISSSLCVFFLRFYHVDFPGRETGSQRVTAVQDDAAGLSANTESRLFTAEQLPSLKVGKLYKWKKSSQVTVISMQPPPAGVEVSVLYYTDNQALQGGQKPQSAGPSATGSERSPAASLAAAPLHVYTPQGLRALLDYSRELGSKIEVRGEELNELLELL